MDRYSGGVAGLESRLGGLLEGWIEIRGNGMEDG